MVTYFLASILIVLTSMNCNRDHTGDNTSHPISGDSASDTLPGDTTLFRSPMKLAVLVGINKYKSSQISTLEGCVNDVESMKATLIGKFGFDEQNIFMLKDTAATHKNIVNAIQQKLIDRAQAGDIVVFHYSGHGSQMQDNQGGDETDGWDETIVPYDSRQGGVFDISDDAMNGLLSSLSSKTKHITWILDSCHSGTAIKGSGKARYVPRDERPAPPAPVYALDARGTQPGGVNDMRMKDVEYVLISGCLSKQNSFEHYSDGAEHGALTYFLTQELDKAKKGVTYRDIMDKVITNVHIHYPNQTPQLEGTLLDQYVFSDSSSIAQPYVLVSQLSAKTVKVQAGKVHGLTKGSVFFVYAPATKEFKDTASAAAKITLTDVGPFESKANITKGAVTGNFYRGVEWQHNYPDLKLIVYYKNLQASTTLKSIKAALDAYKFISVAPEEQHYKILLEERGGKIYIEGPETNQLSSPVAVNQPRAADIMTNKVLQWARWFNMLAIENVSAPNLAEISLKRSDGDGAASSTRIEMTSGERYECTVKNISDKDVYISILDISTDGSIAVIYPAEEGASELLRAGKEVTREFETFVPAGRDSVTDIIKVFVTSLPIDFHTLTQPLIKGDPKPVLVNTNDPLNLLLNQAILDGTRGSNPVNVNQGSWQTARGAVAIKRA